jgi:hypothetical protein
MDVEFACRGCHSRLRADSLHAGAQAQCPRCAQLNDIPSGPTPSLPPPLPGITTAPGPVGERCPSCDSPLAAAAVLCIECGYDRRSGRQRRRKVKRLDRRWTAGPSLLSRLLRLAATLVVLLIALVLALAATPVWPPMLLVAPLVFLAVAVLLVLAMGSTSAFRVFRTSDGQLLLHQSSYLAFIPLGTRTVPLGDFEAIEIIYSEWLGPVHLWWERWDWRYFAYTRDEEFGAVGGYATCRVALRGRHEGPSLTVYRGPEGDDMRAVVDLLQEVSGLPVERGK